MRTIADQEKEEWAPGILLSQCKRMHQTIKAMPVSERPHKAHYYCTARSHSR